MTRSYRRQGASQGIHLYAPVCGFEAVVPDPKLELKLMDQVGEVFCACATIPFSLRLDSPLHPVPPLAAIPSLLGP